MWRSPSEVSTEFGPTIGRSGDSAAIEGASSGLAVNSERTSSGRLVITSGCGSGVRMAKTSPSRRRAPKTNSIWRWLKRSSWARLPICTSGGAGSPAASSGSSGPLCSVGASATPIPAP